jgi:hypothetical protein
MRFGQEGKIHSAINDLRESRKRYARRKHDFSLCLARVHN